MKTTSTTQTTSARDSQAVSLSTLAAVAIALIVATYRAIVRRRPLLKLYRYELRAMYAAAAWMDRHPVLTSVLGYGMIAIFSIQMFIGFMDAWCGL